MERIQKILAAAGVASRRSAEELIRAGRVRVNGQIAHLGDSADPEKDTITLDGAVVQPAKDHHYIMLNKPVGYACTRWDPHLPTTVYQLLPSSMKRLFTVGRLDVDTEGLLLLTSDGGWANDITHPRHHVPKTYVADVNGHPWPEALEALRRGIDLEDGRTLPANVRLLRHRPSDGMARLEITLREGRKRQVRRMLQAVDLEVVHLVRIRIGTLELGRLAEGEWRHLLPDEVNALRGAKWS